MNRRQFLTISTLSISLSGCIEGNFGGTTENTSPTVTETETPSPEGVTPECWPSMCKGTKLVEVISQDFSGDVVLQAECRDEEFSIQSGESVQIDREEDAETCKINISIDSERAYSENIEDYESVILTVSSDGEVEDDWVAV